VQASLKTNDYAGALTHLQEAEAISGRTPYDDYIIQEFYGSIYASQKDYPKAEAAYQAMADSPAMPAEDKTRTLTGLVQLANNSSHWPVVIKYGEQLQAVGPLQPPLGEELAIAYYNTGDHAKAQALANAQIEAAKAAGQPPSQALLQIQMSAQAGQNNVAAATATLEGLVQQYGDPNNWGTLIGLAFNGKGLTDSQALDLYRLRMATGATTASAEYPIMADVAGNGLRYPVEAEAMLEQGISKGFVKPGDKANAMLATIRPQATKDRASIGEFEKVAAQRKAGDYDLKLAEYYFGYGRYADSETAVRRAQSKGGFKDTAEAQMLLGMSLARQDKNAEAAEAFGKVSGNANDQKVAHLWTVYVQRKYGSTTTTAPAEH
jgi:tetratricopeptide (TPR) repeat protein